MPSHDGATDAGGAAAAHWQEKAFRPSTQCPPLKQAVLDIKQSLGFCSHLLPTYPTGQEQIKPSTRSMQVPPLSHGFKAQSSIFTLQSSPANPLAQLQISSLSARKQKIFITHRIFPSNKRTLIYN